MNAFAAVLNAIASLLWPMLVAGFIWYFRIELAGILKRLSLIRRGKLLGQEFELDEKLNQFEVVAEQAQKEAAALPRRDGTADDADGKLSTEDVEQTLLQNARKSPKITLMLLSAQMEKRLRQLLAQTGWHEHIRAVPIQRALEQLQAQGSLPEYVGGAAKLFWDVRNEIIHGGSASDDAILRAIDSGFAVLRALNAVPAETNIVRHVKVPLYSDENCSTLITDATGVILETTSPNRLRTTYRIFPTTKDHFRAGEKVAWEWGHEKSWGKVWYKNPRRGDAITQAWESSGEFIGRHLDDV